MKKIYSFCLSLAMVFFTLSAMAQTAVQGTVVDEAGQPVIGATIIVKGTNTGTTSGADGKFRIAVPAKGQLEISYLGYITETVSDFSKKQIVLKEDKQNIEEVVVTGYGSQKKAHLTGSVATVPVDDIQDFGAGGLASMLGGLVNGMSVSTTNSRPGENAAIYIRDAQSVAEAGGTAQQPLFVIDGYTYPNDIKVGNSYQNMGAEAFNNLDPSMIESISVLKDASAAVYGARAANGVILVTTKKGKLGAPQISYGGSIGIADATYHAKMLNAYDWGRLYNAVTAADPTKVSSLDLKNALFQADELEAMKSLNYDLLDKYWKTAVTQRHSLNISGATERVNYFAGLSYQDQEGNIGRLNYDRWNFNAGVDVKVGKWVRASMRLTGDYGRKDRPLMKIGGSNQENDYLQLAMRPRYIPEYVDGKPIAAYSVSNQSVAAGQHYHFAELQKNDDFNDNMSQNMAVSGSIEWDFGWSKILQGLTLRASYSKSIATNKTNEYGSSYKLYYMETRSGSGNHLYTPVPGEDYEALLTEENIKLANNGAPITNGDKSFLSRAFDRADSYQIQFSANYNRTFGKHTVGAMFTFEKGESESEWSRIYKYDPYEFTNFQGNGVTGEVDGDQSTFTRSESGTMSYLGRINYSYDNKYLFEAVLRSDASTKFAPNNYWGYFPSVSAGWVISQENWFADNVEWVDFLKVRASFGLTGRDNVTPWQWQQMYALDGGGPVFGGPGSAAQTSRLSLNKNISAINRDAHWDKSYKANFGIDWNFLNNRLAFTFDGYYTWNRDMLMSLQGNVQWVAGTTTADLNYGKMDTWGTEFSVSWSDRIGKDFKYKISVNTGYSDNKLILKDWPSEHLYRAALKGDRTDVGLWGLQDMGMFRSYQQIDEYFEKYGITSYLGKSKDDMRPGMLIYKDIRGAYDIGTKTYAGPDGVIDKEEDLVQISKRSGNPYGFTTNLSAEWKGLSINAQISASWGSYAMVSSASRKPWNSLEYSNMPSFWNPDNMFSYQDVYDASGNLVVAQNLDAKYPSLAYTDVNNNDSTFWRISGTRVTLNRLTLAYRIPSKYTKMVGISSFRINVTAQNVCSFFNPYPDKYINALTGYQKYPNLRRITIGLNVSF